MNQRSCRPVLSARTRPEATAAPGGQGPGSPPPAQALAPLRSATGLAALALVGMLTGTLTGALVAAPAQAQSTPASAAPSAAPPPSTAASDARAARPSATAGTAPTRPAAGGGEPAQRVEITGNPGQPEAEERRRSIAGRIVIGREELDRMGDDSLSEVLKRLPGVTVGGGRGGVRMRGMGGGYTAILMDGQRMPPGFSLDSIPPEQIERIEIMRAPVAEFSTRAIAGTINIVMRADFKRRVNELRLSVSHSGPRTGARGVWLRNGQTADLGWNSTVSVYQSDRDTDTLATTTGGEDEFGAPIVDRQTLTQRTSRSRGLFATARLQIRLGRGQSLDLQPFFYAAHSSHHAAATRSAETPAATARLPWTAATDTGTGDNAMARLNGTWNTTTEGGGKLMARFGARLSQNDDHSDTLESGGTAAAGGRQRLVDSRIRQANLDSNGKYSLLIAERHSFSAGWDGELIQRDDYRRELLDGQAQSAAFGDDVNAKVQRLALFGQDEWEWSPTLSFYLGARWEGIRTLSDNSNRSVRNTSSVLTPLAHLVWKLPGADGKPSRDQLRASLTRSYRSPDTAQLVGRPSVSTLYPDLTRPNQPESPDRTGNPDLKPELSWGLEVGYEKYLDAGGVLAVNGYLKRIDNVIRRVITLQPATASQAARWLSRPQNIGSADAAGLEFEAKARASDLLPTTLPINLRSNLSLMWSRVSGVGGPDNRIEGQPPWTVNLGADWTIKGTPLTVGGNWNYTPAFRVAEIDQQVVRESRKSALDAYALWKVSPDLSFRLSLNNILGEDTLSGTDFLNANGTLRQANNTRTGSDTTVGLRAEIKF